MQMKTFCLCLAHILFFIFLSAAFLNKTRATIINVDLADIYFKNKKGSNTAGGRQGLR